MFIPDIPACVLSRRSTSQPVNDPRASLAKPNFLLTQADIDLANIRLARIERAPPTPWTWAKAKRILLTWQVLLFPIMYALYNSGNRELPLAARWVRQQLRYRTFAAQQGMGCEAASSRLDISDLAEPRDFPDWLKSFNAKPAPVPGRSYSVSQINLRASTLIRDEP
mgnify:CR=1 FL=1